MIPPAQEFYEFTQQRLERFSDRTVFLRMFTSEAVHHVPVGAPQ